MKTNVGAADRMIGIVAGLALLSLVFILEGRDSRHSLGHLPRFSGSG